MTELLESPALRRLSARDRGRRLRDQLPQHERQDASVPVVFDLYRRVYAERDRDLLLFALFAPDAKGHFPARRNLAVESCDVEDLRAVEPERTRVRALFELERQH